MSDTTQADIGGGGKPPAKPQLLRSLVEAMGKWRHAPEADVHLVLISAASALPEAKRTEELVGQMSEGVATIGAKRGGKCYQVSDCDFAILVKVQKRALSAWCAISKLRCCVQLKNHFRAVSVRSIKASWS